MMFVLVRTVWVSPTRYGASLLQAEPHMCGRMEWWAVGCPIGFRGFWGVLGGSLGVQNLLESKRKNEVEKIILLFVALASSSYVCMSNRWDGCFLTFQCMLSLLSIHVLPSWQD